MLYYNLKILKLNQLKNLPELNIQFLYLRRRLQLFLLKIFESPFVIKFQRIFIIESIEQISFIIFQLLFFSMIQSMQNMQNMQNKVQQGYEQVEQSYQQVSQGVEYVKQNIVKVFQEPWQDVTAIKITQRYDGCECCFNGWFCCEGENVYDMVAVSEQGFDQRNVGTITENSNCLLRCMCQQFRPFTLEIRTDISNGQVEANTQKSCGCTFTPLMCLAMGCGCFCCNGIPACRPEMVVSSKNSSLGKITNPHRCMGRTGGCCPWENLDVTDQNGQIKYMISSECCQAGQICRALNCIRCCSPCDKLKFKILDVYMNEVGDVTNVYNGCFNEMCTKMDQFIIHFPKSASYNDKLLLINTVIMIDFDIFEDTCQRLA